MNVFLREGVRIDFNRKLNRFSITRDKEFISITPTVFQLLVTLANSESEYDRVSIQQNGSMAEIIKLASNYLLTFTSKGLSSSVLLYGHILDLISINFNKIMNMIKCEKNQKRQKLSYEAKSIPFHRKRSLQEVEDNTARGEEIQGLNHTKESVVLNGSLPENITKGEDVCGYT